LQVANTELDHKKYKAKREVKIDKAIASVGEECHRLCQVMKPKYGKKDSFIQCIVYTFSIDSRKCALYDQIELEFNFVHLLIEARQLYGCQSSTDASKSTELDVRTECSQDSVHHTPVGKLVGSFQASGWKVRSCEPVFEEMRSQRRLLSICF